MFRPIPIIVTVLIMAASAAPPRTVTVPPQPPTNQATPKDTLAARLDSQLLRLLSGQPAPATQDLLDLAPEDRDLVTILIDGLSRFRTIASKDSPQTLAEKIQPLLVMSQRLQNRANLKVLNLTLCQSVNSFGVYEADTQPIVAGRETPTVIYCEIENFQPRLMPGGLFETKLTYELSLYSQAAPQTRLLHKPPTPVLDQCRNRRRDFFIADKVTLPADLKPGPHVLKVTVTDEQAKKVGEASLKLDIVRPR